MTDFAHETWQTHCLSRIDALQRRASRITPRNSQVEECIRGIQTLRRIASCAPTQKEEWVPAEEELLGPLENGAWSCEVFHEVMQEMAAQVATLPKIEASTCSIRERAISKWAEFRDLWLNFDPDTPICLLDFMKS